jgi:hypothetical protein
MSGCGCHGGGCNRPREELSVNPAVLQSAIKNLFTVAVTGIKHFPWPNEEVAALAELIANTLAENERLKALLGLREPVEPQPQVDVDGDQVRLHFGPGNSYTLYLPAATLSQRKELARSLTAAADELKRAPAVKQSLPGQLTFPFKK